MGRMVTTAACSHCHLETGHFAFTEGLPSCGSGLWKALEKLGEPGFPISALAVISTR